jgi:mannitol/fructose-specific phosphotransferase system IIA component (Ntr-type)
VNLARFLSEERVDLDLDATFEEDAEITIDDIAAQMATLLQTSDDIVNATKLRNDLINRERRAPSLLGQGVAMPHVRTMQARKPVMAVGISRRGLDLPTPDDQAVHLVIALVGPPYDDRMYLVTYKRLGEILLDPGRIEQIVASELAGEVLRALAR